MKSDVLLNKKYAVLTTDDISFMSIYVLVLRALDDLGGRFTSYRPQSGIIGGSQNGTYLYDINDGTNGSTVGI